MFNLFKKINKDEQEILECEHIFHSSCLKQWKRTDLKNDLKKDSTTFEFITFVVSIKDRQIHCFKEGENIYNCLCCNMEYTRIFCEQESTIKRIITKIHLKNKGDDIVHYITHWAQLMLYLPLNEIDDNDYMSKKMGDEIIIIEIRGGNGLY